MVIYPMGPHESRRCVTRTDFTPTGTKADCSRTLFQPETCGYEFLRRRVFRFDCNRRTPQRVDRTKAWIEPLLSSTLDILSVALPIRVRRVDTTEAPESVPTSLQWSVRTRASAGRPDPSPRKGVPLQGCRHSLGRRMGSMAAWKARRHTNAGEVQAIHPHRNQFDLALLRRAHVHRSVRQPCRHDVIKPKRTTDLSNGCGSQPAYVHCPGGTTTFVRHAIVPSQIVTPAKITSIPK